MPLRLGGGRLDALFELAALLLHGGIDLAADLRRQDRHQRRSFNPWFNRGRGGRRGRRTGQQTQQQTTPDQQSRHANLPLSNNIIVIIQTRDKPLVPAADGSYA